MQLCCHCMCLPHSKHALRLLQPSNRCIKSDLHIIVSQTLFLPVVQTVLSVIKFSKWDNINRATQLAVSHASAQEFM